MLSKTLCSRSIVSAGRFFLVEMAFRWLGYAQHSGALPSGFVGEAFFVFCFYFA
jgi:hypothetical protein